jgi:hypothetical protein
MKENTCYNIYVILIEGNKILWKMKLKKNYMN